MPIPMNDTDDILQRTGDTVRSVLSVLEVFEELPSTNTYLLEQARPEAGQFRAVLAKHQTGGRGRNGKIWYTPRGSGLCMSLACTFRETPRNLPCLTLAIGVAIAAVLERLGASGLALKWPNDLVARDGKLGGILTEIHPDAESAKSMVIGVGLNVDLPNAMRYAAPRAWTNRVSDLVACMTELPSPAELAAAVITGMIEAVRRFAREGFSPFIGAWREHDWLRSKPLRVQQAQGPIIGIADGIDDDGALRVRTEGGTERVISGSIELLACGAAEP